MASCTSACVYVCKAKNTWGTEFATKVRIPCTPCLSCQVQLMSWWWFNIFPLQTISCEKWQKKNSSCSIRVICLKVHRTFHSCKKATTERYHQNVSSMSTYRNAAGQLFPASWVYQWECIPVLDATADTSPRDTQKAVDPGQQVCIGRDEPSVWPCHMICDRDRL